MRHFQHEAVTVAQGSTDEVMTVQPEDARRMMAEVVVGGQNLDAFQINLKFHPDGDFVVVYDAAAEFNAPAGLLLGCSGDLTTLAVGSGWFALDCEGIHEVQVKASSGNAAGSSVQVRGTFV